MADNILKIFAAAREPAAPVETGLRARIKKRLSNALTVDVELTAPPGITVLFGSSGAGKTTILRAIAGIIAPDEGRITLGKTVFFDAASGCNLPMSRRRVGYVLQHHVLFPHMTAERNVLYGVRADSRQAAAERVSELLTLLGIAHTARRRPHELSGGEQQRVALARALAADPAIMLLDEPLSAVDAPTRARLTEEIAAIAEKTAIPFLYVTHSRREALRLGQKLLVIDDGGIARQGVPAEILRESAPAR